MASPRKRPVGRPRLPGGRTVKRSVLLPRASWAFLEALGRQDGTSTAHHVRVAVKEYQESHERHAARLNAPPGVPLFIDPVSKCPVYGTDG